MGAGSLSAWIHFFHCETPECTYSLLNNNVFIMSVTSLQTHVTTTGVLVCYKFIDTCGYKISI